MRTLIRGGWVVGNSGATHTLIRDGVVVYEDETIVHVGAEFDGQVDREIDASSKLVSPGFIDTHIHSGHRAAHRLITDAGRPEYFGQPFFETLPARRGRPHGGDAGDWVKRADEDEAAHRFGQEDGERLWDGWRNWDVAERTAEEASPWSFPLAG